MQGQTQIDGQDRMWRLPDGRSVCWRSYGDPAGLPVLALHGTPGSRTKFAMADDGARRLGLHLISVDRWGYGGTDRPRQASLPLFAENMAAFVATANLGRTAILGVSGGGPYAAAVAARLGSAVTALGLVAPVGPIAGMADPPGLAAFHTLCFRILPRVPGCIRLAFGFFRLALGVSSAGAMRLAAARAGAADRGMICTPAARNDLAECFRLGMQKGLSGPVIDMQLFSRRWDVDLGSISAPTRLWLGEQDRNVPQQAARRLAQQIASCEMVELPGHGHYWITRHHGEVLEWLSATMRG